MHARDHRFCYTYASVVPAIQFYFHPIFQSKCDNDSCFPPKVCDQKIFWRHKISHLNRVHHASAINRGPGSSVSHSLPQSPTLPLALISPPSVPKLAPVVSHLPDHLWPQAPSHSKSTVSTCALLVDLTLVFVILSFSISTSSLCLHNLAAEEFKVCHISSLIMISIVCSYTIIFYNSISSILCLESCGRAIYP